MFTLLHENINDRSHLLMYDIIPKLYHRYIRQNLAGITEVDVEIQSLKNELEEAKAKITDLKAKLVKYEADEGAE
ncbi:hypothetical protein WN48_09296 [Eufriesea mexicana]|uniref:Uncharacterized protein n=1 Tax=Eufriesea mexicana TaxID=516756 RepID=A0A310SR93_9HYME|nr:hypothetical protein WN48_09296 [Eufriesea mexicana]